MSKSFRPTLLYQDGGFSCLETSGLWTTPGSLQTLQLDCAEQVRLTGKALLPGFVNAHSHSFQRLIRGRANRAL